VVEPDRAAEAAPQQDLTPVLRRMTPADLDALMVVQREGAEVGLANIFPQDQYPFPIDAVRRRWEREMAEPGIDCFVVLSADLSVAGFAATRGNEFLHFGTALGAWGSSLAGRAHDEVIAHLAAQRFPHAWLTVFEGNTRARRFYERRGWHPTGERSRSGFEPYPILLGYQVDLGRTGGLST
jgi:RimJ/RimL family protein N-acetyltransferase